MAHRSSFHFFNKIGESLWRTRNNAYRSHYNIGFVEDDIHDVLKASRLEIKWMKHPYKSRWFADPQLLSVNDREIVVLVEEFSYDTSIGRIAKLVVRRSDYSLQDMKIILDLPTHLSFPFIFRKDGDVYLMPENSQAETTSMYRYNIQTDELTKCSDVTRLPLTDAIITEMTDGKEYVLSTKEPDANKDELQIYAFDSKALTIDDQPVQTIRFDSNIARNAGEVFEVDDVKYRPAQDCNKCYGNGIVLQRLEYTDGKFSLTDVNMFHSDYFHMDLGYHTFNVMNGLIVVDGHGHNNMWMYKTVRLFGKLKRLVRR